MPREQNGNHCWLSTETSYQEDMKFSNSCPSENVWTLWHAHVIICTFIPEIHIFPPTPSLQNTNFTQMQFTT